MVTATRSVIATLTWWYVTESGAKPKCPAGAGRGGFSMMIIPSARTAAGDASAAVMNAATENAAPRSPLRPTKPNRVRMCTP